jgi:hypothetical protein
MEVENTQPAPEMGAESNSIADDIRNAMSQQEATTDKVSETPKVEAQPTDAKSDVKVDGLAQENKGPIDAAKVVPDELTQLKNSSKEFDNIFANIEPQLKQNGISRTQYIKNVIDIDRDLQKMPVDGVMKIMEIYGVDLNQLNARLGRVQQQPIQKKNDDEYIDPMDARLKPVLDKVTVLERQIYQNNYQSRQAKIDAEVSEFKARNPHFSKVEDDMADLIYSYKQKFPHMPNGELLQKAYEKAIYMNSEVREAVFKEAEAKRTKEAAAKAQAAKRAGSSVSGSPSFKVQPEIGQSDDLRKTIEEAMQRHKPGY